MAAVAVLKDSESFVLYFVNDGFVSPRYLDPDMYSMIEDSTNILKSKMFKKLTKSICGLVRIVLFNWYSLIQLHTCKPCCVVTDLTAELDTVCTITFSPCPMKPRVYLQIY